MNKELLPLKLVYFSFSAGFASLLSYATVYLYHLGLTPSQVGLVWGLEPLVHFFCAPLWGSLADKYSKHKQIFLLGLTGGGVSYLFLLFVPAAGSVVHSGLGYGNSIENCSKEIWNDGTHFQCNVPKNDSSTYFLDIEQFEEEICSTLCGDKQTKPRLNHSFLCDLNGNLMYCDVFFGNLADDVGIGENVKFFNESHEVLTNATVANHEHASITTRNDQNNDSLSIFCYQLRCCTCEIKDLPAELLDHVDDEQGNRRLTFGLCISLVFVATVFISLVIPFVDAACFGLLGDHGENFGKQRVWGAVGWGISAVVTGISLDKYNEKLESSITHFDPIFYMFFGFMALTFLCAMFMKFPPHNAAKGMRRKLLHVLKDPRVVVFLVVVFVVGIGFGIAMTFLLLFLDEQKSSSLFIGLSQAIVNIAEIPCYFYSGEVIKRIGHNGVFCLALGGSALRFLGYSIAKTPWVALLFQLLHGITFGLFWPAVTSYAFTIAPEGMVATLQSTITGIHFGIAKAVGIGLGGVIYEKFGSRNLFRSIAGVSLATLMLYCIALRCLGIPLKYVDAISGKEEDRSENDPTYGEIELAFSDHTVIPEAGPKGGICEDL